MDALRLWLVVAFFAGVMIYTTVVMAMHPL